MSEKEVNIDGKQTGISDFFAKLGELEQKTSERLEAVNANKPIMETIEEVSVPGVIIPEAETVSKRVKSRVSDFL